MAAGVTIDELREMALSLPEVTEGKSWDSTSYKVRKKPIVYVRSDGETLALKVDRFERDALIADPSGAFFITPHYEKYPYVVVRLAKVDREELRELLAEAWLRTAPKRLAAEHEERLLGG